MQTLTIAQIFSQLDVYQAQYLNILQDPCQYSILVADASLSIWPCQPVQLCLGELLQLWFGNKWSLHSATQLFDAEPVLRRHLPQSVDLYLYHVSGNLLTGHAKARAWSVSQQQSVCVTLDAAWQYYSVYKSLNTPQAA